MKRGLLSIILVTFGVVVVLAYLVFYVVSFNINESDIRCKHFTIVLSGNVKLINEHEVNQMLTERGLHPLGVPLNHLKTDYIERFMLENPIVKSATCFRTPSGRVYLHIHFREPKFVVLGKESYYVDNERNILPVNYSKVPFVPVVTGHITKTLATGKLFDLVQFIVNDSLWRHQIAQIHVTPTEEIELVPRVGNTLILLGKPEHFEPKFNRLYQLYAKGFTVFGWDMYQKLDLRFDKQVVGVRRSLQMNNIEINNDSLNLEIIQGDR